MSASRRFHLGIALSALSVALLIGAAGLADAQSAAPQVRVEQGLVRGAVVDGINVFRAVPFGAPASGENRFRAPQPAKKWQGVLDVTADGQACPQNASADPASKASADEDCLRLYVFAPQGAASAKRPVMVWIHGGGFSFGYGGAKQYNPTALVKEGGVIVVNVNYRVATLGQLATPDLNKLGEPSGNYGIRDQQAALRWVQKNIAAFGGDPNNVTIAGESAGAQSVLALVVSPLSKGLFHKAIAQSPPTDSHVYSRARLEKVGGDLAVALGCPAGPAQAACLRALPVDKILSTRGGRLQMVEDPALFPLDTFVAFREGKFNQVPLIIGSNLHEGYFNASGTEARLGRAMTEQEAIDQIKASSGDKAEAVLKLYAPGNFPSPAAAVGELAGDSSFACYSEIARAGAMKFAPVYGYEMNEQDPAQQQPRKGVTLANTSYHTSDLAYLFDIDAKGPLTGDAAALGKKMRAYWVQFMKTGSPNGAGLPAWPKYETGGILNLSNTGGVTTDFAARHKCAALERADVLYYGLR